VATEIANTTIDGKEDIEIDPGKWSTFKFEIVGSASTGSVTFDDLLTVELNREINNRTVQVQQPTPLSIHHRLNRYFKNGTVPFNTNDGGAQEVASFVDMYAYGPALRGNVMDVRGKNEAAFTVRPSDDLLTTFGGSVPLRVVGIEEPSGVEAYLRRIDRLVPSLSSVGEDLERDFSPNTTRLFIRDPNGVVKKFDAEEDLTSRVNARVKYDDATFEGVQRINRAESDIPDGGDFADFLNLPFLRGGNGPLDVVNNGAELEADAQATGKIYFYADRVDLENARSERSIQDVFADLDAINAANLVPVQSAAALQGEVIR
jgi:hypothetical protein